jgi:biotin carboxylase
MGDLFWVIGGGLMQIPLVHEAKALGYRTVVSDRDPHCPARQHANFFAERDIFDIDGHLEAARELGGPDAIAAVLAAGIDAPETMAVMARELGLVGVDPEIAHVVNHKNEFRAALGRLGYPVPRHRVLDENGLESLAEVVDEVGLPLIVKNTSSSGSRGTRIFLERDLDAMRATAREAMSVSRSGLALVEELWIGPEQTVETLFDSDGRFHPCFITDRSFDRSDGYAMETGLRHPTALDSARQAELYALAESVGRDLGVSVGAVKLDTILTAGGPRIIEMTVRMSGGFDCQYLVPAATGKNPLRAAALTALGRPFPPELLEDRLGRVGLTSSLWPEPGRITSIAGVERALAIPGVEHIFFRNEVGDVVEPYVDCTRRVCFLIVTGATEDEARAVLAEAEAAVQIVTEPLLAV